VPLTQKVPDLLDGIVHQFLVGHLYINGADVLPTTGSPLAIQLL
jgi:hypothetical protein